MFERLCILKGIINNLQFVKYINLFRLLMERFGHKMNILKKGKFQTSKPLLYSFALSEGVIGHK